MTILFPGSAPTGRVRFSIRTSVTTRRLGGPLTFCSISWTVSNGLSETLTVLLNQFLSQNIQINLPELHNQIQKVTYERTRNR